MLWHAHVCRSLTVDDQSIRSLTVELGPPKHSQSDCWTWSRACSYLIAGGVLCLNINITTHRRTDSPVKGHVQVLLAVIFCRVSHDPTTYRDHHITSKNALTNITTQLVCFRLGGWVTDAMRWNCYAEYPPLNWPSQLPPPPLDLTVQRFVGTLFIFPAGTALGWDLIHPRALARLSHGLLRRFVVLLSWCEILECWPETIQLVLIALLQMGKGIFTVCYHYHLIFIKPVRINRFNTC